MNQYFYQISIPPELLQGLLSLGEKARVTGNNFNSIKLLNKITEKTLYKGTTWSIIVACNNN